MSTIVLNANRQITPPKQQAQRNDYPCNETPDAPHICTLQESPQGQHYQSSLPDSAVYVGIGIVLVCVAVIMVTFFKALK